MDIFFDPDSNNNFEQIYTVQGVILKNGNILAVSRKTDHEDFGLPGGKVDPTDLSLKAALRREIKEETGIDANMTTSTMIFAMHKNKYMGYTYLIKDWEGDIYTEEPHIVKWTGFNEVINGSFGNWNELVVESLISMNVLINKDYVRK